MNYQDLPSRWQNRLATYLQGNGLDRITLRAGDFDTARVSLRFDDDTTLNFRNALVLTTSDELAVFTEHCGYHIFDRVGIVSWD